jgi:hypothetical protein
MTVEKELKRSTVTCFSQRVRVSELREKGQLKCFDEFFVYTKLGDTREW